MSFGFNDIEDTIATNIERMGWSLMGVMAKVPFTYTVGLEQSYEHPELILVGLPPELAAMVLNNIGALVKSGRILKAGEELTPDEVEFSVGFRIGEVCIESQTGLLCACAGLYGRGRFRSLQVLWPDPQGRWPGEDGCANPQPLLTKGWDAPE